MIVAERILSISGLRGIVGDGLDPNFVVKFSQALGILSDRGTVVVGRDGRSTGKMLKLAVQAGLESVGCQVIDAGIVSTPTCGFLVRHLKAAAGIEITASHNPIEWNGLKPFSREGSVFNEDAGRRLLDLLEDRRLEAGSLELAGIDRGTPGRRRCASREGLRTRRGPGDPHAPVEGRARLQSRGRQSLGTQAAGSRSAAR